MPRAAVGGRSVPLIERAGELERIERALGGTRSGQGTALLFEGPAGIGKTALLDAARARAQELEIGTLYARGGELEGHFPYGVVRALFEPTLLRLPATARRRLLSGAARLAAPVVSGAGELPAGGADTAFGLMHGLHWLTVNLSLRTPVAMFVDDAQWSDAPSLRFLIYLCGRLEGIAVTLLVATRSGERGGAADLAAALAGQRAVEVLRPAALSVGAVAELAAASLGETPVDERFAAACREATGGVPFLVGELLAALAADQVAPSAAAAGRVRELGPSAVARATLVRLGRMPEGCLALARAVAVLAADAELPRVARLSGLDDRGALRALDALVAGNVLRTDERGLAFVHPILRAAIYDALAPGERSELHRRAADLLAADGAELDAIASQLMASEPTGSTDVAERLREAAARALGRGAPEDGVAYLTRALAEGCGRELRAELSFELATAAKLAGRLRLAVEHYEETRRLAEDPGLRARAALELALMRAMRGAWDASTALVDAALAELDEGSSELAVHLECLRAGVTASDPRLVEGFDRRLPALRELTRAEVPSARSLALLLAGVAGWRGEEAEANALVERGWEGQPLLDGVDGWALGQGLNALVFAERLADAGRLGEQLLAESRTAGSLSGFLLGSAYGGWIEARRGRLLAAEGALRVALEPALVGRLNFTLSWQLWLAIDVLLERPQAAELAAGTESVELGSMAVLHSGAMLSEVRGRVRHAAGKTAEAIADVRRAGEILTALGHVNPNASSWRSALALMLASHEREEAMRLAHSELADARRFGHPRALGVALRTLGLLEGGVRGRRRLEQAVQILAGSPARLEHARALVELGAAMRRSGERAAAREPLRLGLDIAAAGGATRLLERARTELAASGARPRRERVSGVEALTPSELRVARLAAEGRTNNEVAQALFVTAKTVDTHLSHAYAKLGISSRRALATALARQPPKTS